MHRAAVLDVTLHVDPPEGSNEFLGRDLSDAE